MAQSMRSPNMALAYCSLLSEELSKALHTTVNFDTSPEVGCSTWRG